MKTHIATLIIIAIPLATSWNETLAAESAQTTASAKTVIPDTEYLAKLCNQMAREERSNTHTARDKMVAYVNDLSKPDQSRTLCVDFLGAVKSEENLKTLASLLSDRSASVRTRAFYGLPDEVRSRITDYDYTTTPIPKDFTQTLQKIYRIIEEYSREKKTKKA